MEVEVGLWPDALLLSIGQVFKDVFGVGLMVDVHVEVLADRGIRY